MLERISFHIRYTLLLFYLIQDKSRDVRPIPNPPIHIKVDLDIQIAISFFVI